MPAAGSTIDLMLHWSQRSLPTTCRPVKARIPTRCRSRVTGLPPGENQRYQVGKAQRSRLPVGLTRQPVSRVGRIGCCVRDLGSMVRHCLLTCGAHEGVDGSHSLSVHGALGPVLPLATDAVGPETNAAQANRAKDHSCNRQRVHTTR
jgi:hypothetical protein